MSEHLYRKVDPGQPTPWFMVPVEGPVYRPTGMPQARPQELEDLIQDGWLVEVGEETT